MLLLYNILLYFIMQFYYLIFTYSGNAILIYWRFDAWTNYSCGSYRLSIGDIALNKKIVNKNSIGEEAI